MVRRQYLASAAGDLEALRATLAPDVEWTEMAGFPLAGTYRTPEGVTTNVMEKLGADWDGWTAHDDTIAQTDLIDSMIEFFTRDGAPLSAELFARQCSACLEHDALARLGEIRQPTLVIGGAYDLLTPPKLQRELAGAIRDARLVSIPSGAHLVMVEAAETWNRAVLQFLSEGR